MAQQAIPRDVTLTRQGWFERNRSAIVRHGVINLFNLIIILPLAWVLMMSVKSLPDAMRGDFWPRTFDFTPTAAPVDPDFNFRSLRGNAVLRWEYLPGSTLFFVWTQTRQDAEGNGDFAFHRSLDRLMQAPADNIFMIKATYWWNP